MTVSRIRTKCAVENPDSPPHDQVQPWATSIILQRVQLRASPTVCHSRLSLEVSFTSAESQQKQHFYAAHHYGLNPSPCPPPPLHRPIRPAGALSSTRRRLRRALAPPRKQPDPPRHTRGGGALLFTHLPLRELRFALPARGHDVLLALHAAQSRL